MDLGIWGEGVVLYFKISNFLVRFSQLFLDNFSNFYSEINNILHNVIKIVPVRYSRGGGNEKKVI